MRKTSRWRHGAPQMKPTAMISAAPAVHEGNKSDVAAFTVTQQKIAGEGQYQHPGNQ
jgi:hypothetical protein